MNDSGSKYECPSCERAILNRKIDKCLYCGATLPENLLFSKEQIVEVEKQDSGRKEQRSLDRPSLGADYSDTGFNKISDVIDTATVIDNVIDIALDLGDLFD